MNREELERAFQQAKAAGDFENAYQIEQELNQAPVDYKFSETAKNFPGSLYRAGKEAAHAVMNPVDTAQALGQLVSSGVDKAAVSLTEAIMGGEAPDNIPGVYDTRAADAVGGFYKDRYGSMDALKTTAMEDPAGMMLDATAALSPLSGVKGVSKAVSAIDPITGTARAAQTAAKALIPEGTAAKLYESAAKFSTAIPSKERGAMVATALEHGIMPTQKGVKKVADRVDALNTALDDLIETAGANGTKIPVDSVFMYLDDLKKQKGGNFQFGAGDDLAAIQKIEDNFRRDLDDWAEQAGARISAVSPQQLQNFKKGIYRRINWNAKNKQTPSMAGEDAMKAMGRAAKDEIVKAVPEASEINKLLGDLLELQPNLIRAAGRIDNRNLISLDTSVKTGAGVAGGAAYDAAGVGAGLGLALSLLGSPKIKPRIAIALKRLRDGDINWINQNLGDPGVRAGLVLAGRAEEIISAANGDAQ